MKGWAGGLIGSEILKLRDGERDKLVTSFVE